MLIYLKYYYIFFLNISNSALPIVFISYRDNKNDLKITSLFHLVPFKYEVNVLYYVHDLMELKRILFLNYSNSKEPWRKYSWGIHEPSDGNFTNEWVKNSLCKQDIYNPALYKSPYRIVDEVSHLLSIGQDLDNYFATLFFWHGTNIRFHHYTIHFRHKCKDEIILFLTNLISSQTSLIYTFP